MLFLKCGPELAENGQDLPVEYESLHSWSLDLAGSETHGWRGDRGTVSVL